MKSFRAPFTLLLPLLAIVIWTLLVALPITLVYTQMLRHVDAAGAFHFRFGTVQQHGLLHFAALIALAKQAEFVAALNIPGQSIALLFARCSSSWPMNWNPTSLNVRDWNAISLPFLCLPFWWLAGRGIDAARGRNALRWPMLLLGTLLSVFFLFIACGLVFGLPESDKKDLLTYTWGLPVWVLLLSAFPIAWVRQRRHSAHPQSTTQE